MAARAKPTKPIAVPPPADPYANPTPESLAAMWDAAGDANNWRAAGDLIHDAAGKRHFAIVTENRVHAWRQIACLSRDADGSLRIELRLGPTLPEYQLEGESPHRTPEVFEQEKAA